MIESSFFIHFLLEFTFDSFDCVDVTLLLYDLPLFILVGKRKWEHNGAESRPTQHLFSSGVEPHPPSRASFNQKTRK